MNNLKKDWLRKLDLIPLSEWKEFRVRSNMIYSKGRWCHLAWCRSRPNQVPDGSVEQEVELQDGKVILVIPDNCEFGYPSSGRFALLSGKENSYWVADYETGVVETAQPDKDAYSFHKTLIQGTPILDLSTPDCKFLLRLKSLRVIQNNEEFFSCLCGDGEEDVVYPITHAISEKAYQNGYKGLLYQSARIRDVKHNGISNFKCLVAFERDVLSD